MTEVIWWWCWRCGFAGTIAAFLLGCWVPPLPMGMWLLPQAASSTRDGTCAQPCCVGLTGELRKNIDHRTPGRSHGTLGRSYRQRGPGGGIFLGLEPLVLSPAWCSSPPGSPGVGDSHGAHTRG